MRAFTKPLIAIVAVCLAGLLLSGCPAKPVEDTTSTIESEPWPDAATEPTEPEPVALERPEGAPEPPVEPSEGWAEIRVAATILTRKHPFYKELEAALVEAAEDHNITLDVQSSEFDSQKQRAQVQNFVVEGYDAIIVCPADSDSVGGAIQLANDAHIPVFTADIAANSGDVVANVASDNVQGGRLAGEYLAEALGGAGEVIIIDHPTVTSVQDRVRGFEEALAEHEGMTVVDKPAADGQRDKAQKRAQNALLANPGAKAIFGINDDSALGALAALRQAGNEDILIIGYDATEEARKEILAGSPLVADVVQYPDWIARLTIEAIVKYLSGEDVPDEIPVPVGIVDKAALEAGA
ncbi:MAG TPA: substrate-binding domain-containing protein [Armatimonadota bacterium]|nr:substrate-binding domain-containing protein [Armatimonadota bacterium]